MIDARIWGGKLFGLLKVAVRSFLGALLVVTLAGLVLAGASYYFLRDYSPWAGPLAAGVAIAESVSAGLLLGSQRAMVMSLAHGLQTLGVGKSLVMLLFHRMLGVSAEEKFGERGNWTARQLECLPLAQAEQRLGRSARELVSAQPNGGGLTGWFRRWLERKLVAAAKKYTLAAFREEDRRQGGVDLVKVQADLETRIDDQLIAGLRKSLNLWTILVIFGLPFAVFVQTYILILLLHAK